MSWHGELTNVSFNLVSLNSILQVDGIVETSGALFVYGGGVMIVGSPAGRTVVNAGTAVGMGIVLYGGRYAGASGCAALMTRRCKS